MNEYGILEENFENDKIFLNRSLYTYMDSLNFNDDLQAAIMDNFQIRLIDSSEIFFQMDNPDSLYAFWGNGA